MGNFMPKLNQAGTAWQDPDWEQFVATLTPSQVVDVRKLMARGLVAPIPRGMSWITDTIHGFDVYKYIPRRPTLYIDVSNTASWNRGTYYHPYNTEAAIRTVLQGDLRGQVIGLMRGTTLSLTNANGLQLAMYGTSTDPVWMVPYGDAEALPVITGGAVFSDWAPTTNQEANNIWQRTMTQADVWEAGSRLTAKTWTTNIATTALSAGQTTYSGGVLYVRPSDGLSPNLGQMVCAITDYALNINHANVAAAGYVIVGGLHVHTARNNVFQIVGGASTTNISTVAGYQVMGCKIGRAGTDKTGLGNDAFSMYGAYNAAVKRITGARVVGNYLYDSLNNAVELAGSSGTVVELNQSYRCEGHGITEYWSENNDCVSQYNISIGYMNLGRTFNTARNGAWFANHCYSAGSWDGDDATNTLNANNSVIFNIIDTPGSTVGYFLSMSGGTGHKFQHNTCYWDPAKSISIDGCAGVRSFAAVTTAAAQGFCDISNNLFAWGDTTGSASIPYGIQIGGTLGATAQIPTGRNNYWVHCKGAGANLNWVTSAGGQQNLSTFKTILTGAGYAATTEVNSDVTGSSGTLTKANVGFRPATYQVAPIDGTVTKTLLGITTLTTIGTRRYDGTPYDPATCVSGALLRASV